jgi:hypothetical protein
MANKQRVRIKMRAPPLIFDSFFTIPSHNHSVFHSLLSFSAPDGSEKPAGAKPAMHRAAGMTAGIHRSEDAEQG